MAGQATLSAADGTTVPGALHVPAGGPGRGAVVLIHEWWGLNGHIHGVADRLTREGFTVFAVDLYGGKVAPDAATAGQYMGAVDWKAAVETLLRASEALHARAPGTKVGVTGFCMGGAAALLLAARDPQLAACVPFYGIPQESRADLTRIRAPVLGHYARHDEWCTPERVDALEQKLKAAGIPVELHRYDAQHAFFNDTRPEVYSAQDAETAWRRTVAFFRAQLA
jgi:carboxymethylenebutenolidase